jgi:dihydrofolate reductase
VSADGVVSDPQLWAMDYRDAEVEKDALDQADWYNSTVIRGDAAAEVARLRQQDGQDLALYGHGLLAQALQEHGLVDELRLSIHPVLAGHGQLLFREGGKTPLKLMAARTFGTGVVVLSYQPGNEGA